MNRDDIIKGAAMTQSQETFTSVLYTGMNYNMIPNTLGEGIPFIAHLPKGGGIVPWEAKEDDQCQEF